MHKRTFVAVGFSVVLAAWFAMEAQAGDGATRDNLVGTWQVDEGASHETWSLESRGDILRIVRTDEGKVTMEVKCKLDGSDCSGTDDGKKVKVTLYFNGPALVEMETKDTYVTTRKFALEGGTDRMNIEVNPITGPGKRYTLQLTRHLQAAVR